jgi:predicted nucleic acid-binding protein
VITAVDTSVLLDVFTADPVFGPRSREALRGALAGGNALACSVVWAEVGAAFGDASAAATAMSGIGVGFDELDQHASLEAGQAWRTHRALGGTRQRVVADFLIGAHAASAADRLLTRDRGFYRAYFGALTVVDPSAT